MRYIKGLDTLRAFAVIFVIFHHWDLPFHGPESFHLLLLELLPSGNFGVDLFFVLSGYLITSILMNALKKDPNKIRIIKNFIIRRSLRIFPVYYLTIFVLLLLNYPNMHEDLLWCLTYTYNILAYRTQTWRPMVHLWSLAVEEQFYLIWPWCIVFIKEKYLKYVFFAAMIVGIISLIITIKVYGNIFGLYLMPSCMLSFGIGGLYAWLSEKGREKGLQSFIFFCNIALPFALTATMYWAFTGKDGHFYYLFRTAYVIICVWLIHRVIHFRPGKIKTVFLENPVLMKIGQVSYGIYLFHKPLPYFSDQGMKWIAEHTDSPLFANFYFMYGIDLLLLFLLSLASYHFFEKPVMQLKRYFEY